MTPPKPTSFLSHHAPQCPHWLIEKAVHSGGKDFVVGVVGANSLVAMETAMQAYDAGLATPHLIGDRDHIHDHAATLGWDITAIGITAATDENEIVNTAAQLARDGHIQALLKGHVHTDRFMAGILKRDNGIRGDQRLVHIFALFPPDGGKPLLISDAAVNVEPDLLTRQTMLTEMARIARMLGQNRPRLAIISATETPIPSVPSSMAARELADWGKANLPWADISGPLSLDLALSPDAVAIKMIKDDPVAGYADGLLMPELTSGNVLFKSLVWFNGACATGVVSGGKVPIMLTSRADPPAARIASVALAAQIYFNTGESIGN